MLFNCRVLSTYETLESSQYGINRAWWLMPVTTVLGRGRQNQTLEAFCSVYEVPGHHSDDESSPLSFSNLP